MQDLPHPGPRRGDGRLRLPHPRRGECLEGTLPDRHLPHAARRGPRLLLSRTRRDRGRGEGTRGAGPHGRRGGAASRAGHGHDACLRRAGPGRGRATGQPCRAAAHVHPGHGRGTRCGDGGRRPHLRARRGDRFSRRQLPHHGGALREVWCRPAA